MVPKYLLTLRTLASRVTFPRRAGKDLALAGVIAALTLLIYAPPLAPASVSIDLPPDQVASTEAETRVPPARIQPSPHDSPGVFESFERGVARLRLLQLEDVVGAINRLTASVTERILLAVPIGSFPYRLTLLSASFGALTVALCALFVRRLGAIRAAAAAGALALGFSGAFWSEAAVASANMPRSACLLVVLLSLLKWADTRTVAFLWMGWGVYVLSLGDHPFLLSILPAMVFYVYTVRSGRHRKLPFVITASWLALAVVWSGIAPYVLPGPALLALQVPRLSEIWIGELTPLGILFFGAGIGRLMTHRTRDDLLLLAALVGVMSWMLHSDLTDRTSSLPMIVLAFAVVGSGMSWIAEACIRQSRRTAVVAVLLVLPVVSFVSNHAAAGQARAEQAVWFEYAEALSEALPDNAVIAAVENAREPVLRFWQFDMAGAPPVIRVPPTKVWRLKAGGQTVYVFNRSRAHLVLLGLRFARIGRMQMDVSLGEYLERAPRGTLVAAAASAEITELLRSQHLLAFRSVGGGTALLDEPGRFYGIVGVKGRGRALERADSRNVRLRVEAGDSIGTDVALSPVTLEVSSDHTGGRIEVNGRTVIHEQVGMALAIVTPTGDVETTHSVVERGGDLRVALPTRGLAVARMTTFEPCAAIGSERWVDVSGAMANGRVGILFSASQALDQTLQLYIAGSESLVLVRSAMEELASAVIDFEVFDTDDPIDSAALAPLLDFDGLGRRHAVAQQRYVHLVHVRPAPRAPLLAGLPLNRPPQMAFARAVGTANDAETILVCPGRRVRRLARTRQPR